MLNLQFLTPFWSNKEVEKAAMSAQKVWEAKNDKEANKIAIEKGYLGLETMFQIKN